jgi:hypothetical protein
MASGLRLRLLQRRKKASDEKTSGFSVGLLFRWGGEQQTLQRLPSEAAESLLWQRRLKESLQSLAEKLADRLPTEASEMKTILRKGSNGTLSRSQEA